jgi:WD40 repeat protein
LAHSYTCFAWGQDVATQGVDALGVCAVGTSDGVIIIWDLTRGVVVRTIGTPGAAPPPTDIHFSSDLKSIFACSSDSSMFEYSVSTGETKQVVKGFKKGALRLAVNQKVLAAAR